MAIVSGVGIYQHNTIRSPIRKNQAMTNVELTKMQKKVAKFATKFKPENAQEVLDAGTALITTGLAYLDLVGNLDGEDDGVLDGETANRLVQGLAWLTVHQTESGPQLKKFLEALEYLIVARATTLNAEQRADLTTHLAVMYGSITAFVINATLPVTLNDDQIDDVGKNISASCVAAAIRAAINCVEAVPVPATSEQSESEKP